jgi:hypothetical protein
MQPIGFLHRSRQKLAVLLTVTITLMTMEMTRSVCWFRIIPNVLVHSLERLLVSFRV